MKAYIAVPIDDANIVELKRKYQPNSHSWPHITLVPPGQLLTSVNQAKEALSELDVKGLVLTGEGYGVFEGSKVFYLNLAVNKQLQDLRAHAIAIFSGRIISDEHHQDYGEFNPHITIAKFHTQSEREELAQKLESENLHSAINLGRLALIIKEVEADLWQESATKPLTISL